MQEKQTPWVSTLIRCLVVLLFVGPLWPGVPRAGAEDSGIKQTMDSAVERAQEFSAETKAAIQGRDPSLLTRDAIVSWVMIGVMVGAVAGAVLRMKAGMLALIGNVLLGCLGAFIGGIIVEVGKLDWGWGTLRVSYEELAISLVAGILMIVASRSVLTRMAARNPGKK